MKILIFGATGKTGQLLIKTACEKGHEVTAFVRSPEKIAHLQYPTLNVVKGDIFRDEDVTSAVKGQDVVILALGATAKTTEPILSKATKHILSAMEKQKVSRLICMSGLGAGDSFSSAYLKKKLLMLTVIRQKYHDKTKQEELIKKSQTDWTILHPTDLTDEPYSGTYKTAERMPELAKKWRASVSRADVADCIIKEAEENRFINKTVIITSE